MTALLEILSLGCLLLVAFVYVGYPLSLGVLSLVASKRPVRQQDITPHVTLLVSCFNEEAVLANKLRNALSSSYPSERFEIIVVSDASDDRTDEIARSFAARGVRLIRQEERLGKTSALNLAVPQAKGEIVVFSDANAFYQPDAIAKLVRNFADDRVGYVVGEARYTTPSDASGSNESLYWRYEIWLKKSESRLHSMVGGDGAIYAIRRELYEPLRVEDINDFVNPLQIIAKGYRGIYEPEAVALEETAGSFQREFRRKVRIVNRSFSGLMRVRAVLNPFRVGVFAFEVWFHKLLRWWVPVFLIVGVAAAMALALGGSTFFTVIALGVVLFYLAFYAGYTLGPHLERFPVLLLPYYFTMVNVAALLGVFRSLRGRVQATWTSARARTAAGRRAWAGPVVVHLVLIGLVAVALKLLAHVL